MSSSWLWITLTVLAYGLARWMGIRIRLLDQPIVFTAIALAAVLLIGKVPYATYARATAPLSFLVGPATVALAVPLYRNARAIQATIKPALAAISVGAIVGLTLSPLLVMVLGGSVSLAQTMAPKSTTTPIAMEISRALGGIPELTAVFTIITGLIGSMLGPRLLHFFGYRDATVVGLAVGISSHAIGTAQMMQESETHGTYSGFAMAITGVVTALVSIPFYG